jgi:hypothetical protein
MEIRPNVKYPDQTEDAMFSSFSGEAALWKSRAQYHPALA